MGFNIDRFDLAVLSGYTDRDLSRIRTLDLLQEMTRAPTMALASTSLVLAIMTGVSRTLV